MLETVDERGMPDEETSPLVTQLRKYAEFSRRLLRRWWVVVVGTALGAGGSIAVALILTPVYESRTLVAWKEGVAQSRILTGDESEAVRHESWLRPRVEQMVSSHTRLWRLAQELGLFEKERKRLPPEVVLELLRKAIKFDTVGMDSVWIAFEYRDAVKAQLAAERLAKEFVAQNVSDKVKIAKVTESFVDAEVNKVKAVLDGIESQLAEFVAEHPQFQMDPATGMPLGAIRSPRVAATNLARYANIRNPELRRAFIRKGQVEAQLQLATNPQGDPRLTQAKQDVLGAQRLLAAKRRLYTEQHPDVQRAQRYLVQMQLQLRQTQQESVAGGSVARLREELADLDRTIARLQRTQVRKPIAGEPKPKTKEASSDEGLSQSARLEKRWYQLTRDREITKAKFDQLYDRLTKARVTAALETRRAETQFSIVDRANLPTKPVRPSRPKLLIAGTALGFLIGLGLAALMVILDPRIYNEDDLRRVCDLPILAQVPREA